MAVEGDISGICQPSILKGWQGACWIRVLWGVLKSPVLFSEVQTEEDNSGERECKTLEVSW